MVYKRLADGRVVPYAYEEEQEQAPMQVVVEPVIETKVTSKPKVSETKPIDLTKEVLDGKI